ncbi:P-loop NTPase fold protein [Poseidonocella sedimentorum]|uniref:KAP family P-loop domain-containing protein n=1 Tax=Poseidonocella sedimentorum TaxID=871652 RepID=A0A1I6DPX2_9RHOB|nr:P-loop NTPase fold protein [Poseidonocella sedimentorum]SFR07427.1 KAP family P-loop domain-containing protein [Poseidonocella sedimentorum]
MAEHAETAPGAAAIWESDLLEFAALGDAYTNLVQSLDDSRTISIEAGFGRGKTFFRERWAKQLTEAGELVVEIDLQKSDHTGDPVITLLGALLAKVPKKETDRWNRAVDASKKWGGVAAKVTLKAVLRDGAGELADAFSSGEASVVGDLADSVVKDAGKEMSNFAGRMIEAQLATEEARANIKDNLTALHEALTEGRDRPNHEAILAAVHRMKAE